MIHSSGQVQTVLDWLSANEELLVVDPRSRNVHLMNETAGRIWELLAEKTSVDELVSALGEEYESKWFPDLQKMVGKEYLDPEVSHLTHRPIPTCLRNHCIISEVAAGRGPIHMVTMRALVSAMEPEACGAVAVKPRCVIGGTAPDLAPSKAARSTRRANRSAPWVQ